MAAETIVETDGKGLEETKLKALFTQSPQRQPFIATCSFWRFSANLGPDYNNQSMWQAGVIPFPSQPFGNPCSETDGGVPPLFLNGCYGDNGMVNPTDGGDDDYICEFPPFQIDMRGTTGFDDSGSQSATQDGNGWWYPGMGVQVITQIQKKENIWYLGPSVPYQLYRDENLVGLGDTPTLAKVAAIPSATNSDNTIEGMWTWVNVAAFGAISGFCVIPTPNLALAGYLAWANSYSKYLAPGTCIGIFKANITGCFSSHPINEAGLLLPANLGDVTQVTTTQDNAVEPQATYSGFIDRAICFWIGRTPDQVPHNGEGISGPFDPHQYGLIITK